VSEEELLKRIGLFVRRVVHRIRRDFPKAIQDDLCGGCAVASYLFDLMARRCGMASSLTYGHVDGLQHAWVTIDRRTIVDVTATQFGRFPTVFIVDADFDIYEAESFGEEALARVNAWGDSHSPARYQAPRLHYPRLHRAVDRVFGR